MIKINGEAIIIGKFPNKEIHIEKEKIKHLVKKNRNYNKTKPTHIAMTLKYENDSDLIHLMFIKAELDRLYPTVSKTLYITYMPYSRMDRENDVYIFTLKYISKFINDMGFEAITVEEPHSDVCLALLDSCNAIYITKDYLQDVITSVGFDVKKDYLFFPDAGAQKRYSDLTGFKTLVGYKERDMRTGRITKYDVIGDIEKKGSKIIILDDLSSKGGTFLLAAEKLKERGAGDIYLFVGHTEQTIFNGAVLNTDLIKKVITSDSMNRETDEKIVTIERGQTVLLWNTTTLLEDA